MAATDGTHAPRGSSHRTDFDAQAGGVLGSLRLTPGTGAGSPATAGGPDRTLSPGTAERPAGDTPTPASIASEVGRSAPVPASEAELGAAGDGRPPSEVAPAAPLILEAVSVPFLDTGIGIAAGYGSDQELIAAAEQQRNALHPNARAALERLQAKLERTFLFGDHDVIEP